MALIAFNLPSVKIRDILRESPFTSVPNSSQKVIALTDLVIALLNARAADPSAFPGGGVTHLLQHLRAQMEKSANVVESALVYVKGGGVNEWVRDELAEVLFELHAQGVEARVREFLDRAATREGEGEDGRGRKEGGGGDTGQRMDKEWLLTLLVQVMNSNFIFLFVVCCLLFWWWGV
jgi:hypothetical protein